MGISYDDPETLAAFASRRAIAFPLLSDGGSKTIDRYGVRDEEARGGQVDGIPHPGTIIVDRDGVIRAKLFLEGYKQRHSVDAIIAAAEARWQP